eukprot:6214547-Pleurochrysis_carterae.AAC.1
MAPTGQVLALLALGAATSAATEVTSRRYDAVVLGGGIKESLVAALLASHGRRVLQERNAWPWFMLLASSSVHFRCRDTDRGYGQVLRSLLHSRRLVHNR